MMKYGESELSKMRWIHRYRTPAGFDDILMGSDGKMLTGLWFQSFWDGDDRMLPVFRDTDRWLDIYFSGRQPDFLPPYHMDSLTPFRKEVIDELLEVPFGKTTTYGDIAGNIALRQGIEKMSAQAVGGAVGWNPICIIIPCHRVIGSDGSLTGYGGGVQNKAALLRLEGWKG